MRFSLNDVDRELTADQVRDRLTGVLPGRVRHHGVRVDKRIYPIKQAFEVAAGLPRSEFTTHAARSHFAALGFELIGEIEPQKARPQKQPPMATPRVAAGALIRDGVSRVLLVRPTDRDGWDIPGGYVEPGESPAAACARELAEGIQLTQPTGRLLIVDWAPHQTEGDKLLFIFDGGEMSETDAGSLVVDGDEIAEAKFHDAENLDSLMPERLSRRVRAALDAAIQKVSVYAEHGMPLATGQVSSPAAAGA